MALTQSKDDTNFPPFVTETDLKVYMLIVACMLIAIWGTYAFRFVESNKPERIAFDRFLIPSILIATFYAYYSGVRRSSHRPIWTQLFLFLSILLIFTILFHLAFKGAVILWNGYVGDKESVAIKGTVRWVELPRRQGLLNTYKTQVLLHPSNDTYTFDITGKKYEDGSSFEKQMIQGSLGFLCSN
jgi:hypothetical protein